LICESSDILSRVITFCFANVDYCASQCYLYSADELRCLDKQTLHHLLYSQSLRIGTEDGLLRVLIDLGSDYCDYFDYLEGQFLTVKGVSDFLDSLEFDKLTQQLWMKVSERLKGTLDEAPFARRVPPLFTSTILTILPPLLKEVSGNAWTLLYRGTTNSFQSSMFHAKCDGRPNILMLILTAKGSVFGGFTPLAWDSSGTYKHDDTRKSFIFTLKNPQNTEPRKFALSSSQNAIYCHSTYGPTFWSHDIYVADSYNVNASRYTNIGNAYVNGTWMNGQQILTGEQHFTVKEIEVVSINL
jgi:hypothetical protein